QGSLLTGVAFAQQANIHGEGVKRRQHGADMPWAGRACGGQGPGRRSGASTYHGGDAACQCLVDLLGTDEVYVRVDGARSNDHAFPGNDFGSRSNDYRDARLYVRIARLTQAGDQAVLDADISLDDAAHGVDDERIGNDRVGTIGADALALSHAVAYDLAAAELDLFAKNAQVLLASGQQPGVGRTYTIADAVDDGRPEHLGIGLPGDNHHNAPMMSPLKPNTLRSPARAINSTVRFWPGSKRTAVPAAIFSRQPRARARSKHSALLTSAK